MRHRAVALIAVAAVLGACDGSNVSSSPEVPAAVSGGAEGVSGEVEEPADHCEAMESYESALADWSKGRLDTGPASTQMEESIDSMRDQNWPREKMRGLVETWLRYSPKIVVMINEGSRPNTEQLVNGERIARIAVSVFGGCT